MDATMTDPVTISFVGEVGLKNTLEKIAAAEDRTVSSLLRIIVRDWLDKRAEQLESPANMMRRIGSPELFPSS
jgi:hypothetical protein